MIIFYQKMFLFHTYGQNSLKAVFLLSFAQYFDNDVDILCLVLQFNQIFNKYHNDYFKNLAWENFFITIILENEVITIEIALYLAMCNALAKESKRWSFFGFGTLQMQTFDRDNICCYTAKLEDCLYIVNFKNRKITPFL